MRIHSLQVTDFKRIEFASIVPGANVVEIAGKNANGKTSLLDAIMVLLAGKDAIPEEPVRAGAERSEIVADLGDLTVRRTIKADRSGTITVSTKDGARMMSPQEVLNKLLGDLTFDPLLFVRLSAAEQLDMLRSFAPDIDFDDLDAREKEYFDERTDVNRETKRLQAIVDSAKDVEDLPEAEDISDLLDQQTKAREKNAKIREAAQKRKDADNDLAGMRKALKASEDELEALRSRVADEEARIAELTPKIDALATRLANVRPLPDLEDEAAITERIRELQSQNSERAAAMARAEQVKTDRTRLQASAEKAITLTNAIATIQREREEALKSIDLPIKGLAMSAGGILFNGHPISQASFAQQIRLGVALAMKLNPKLKVAIIKEASLLDDDNLAALHKMAEQGDFQVWIERVGNGSKDAIVIEEGVVKGAPPKPDDEPAPAKRKAK
jgi:predicted ATP-dependent endonuclease of OLD family